MYTFSCAFLKKGSGKRGSGNPYQIRIADPCKTHMRCIHYWTQSLGKGVVMAFSHIPNETGLLFQHIHIHLITPYKQAYFNVQLITTCAVVKLKCAVVKGNLCSCKMCSCWHKINIFINNIVVDKLLFKKISVTCFRLVTYWV